MMLHKQISLPSRVDIFMKAHLKILIGGIKIFQAKLAKFMDEMANIQTNLDDDDVGSENIDEKFQNESCYENWMGFGKDPKHQKFNWVNSDNSSKINKNNENLKDENLNDENLNDENLNDEDLNYQSISETNENNLDMSDTKESSIITSNLNDSIAKDHSYHLSSSPLVEIKIEKLDPVIINQEKKNKHEGKYFKPCPDIKLINDGIVKKIESGKKGNNIIIRKNTKIIRNLLLNGNVSGPIKIGNDSWFAFNTCPFDSIAQLIYSAALENPKFFNF
ncbi:probable DNA replication complex GINS protein PSF3 [Cotesia glomerata]|nr:probable DNA replication complex GINS protein PSF3 [Cotesia glomerata]